LLHEEDDLVMSLQDISKAEQDRVEHQEHLLQHQEDHLQSRVDVLRSREDILVNGLDLLVHRGDQFRLAEDHFRDEDKFLRDEDDLLLFSVEEKRSFATGITSPASNDLAAMPGVSASATNFFGKSRTNTLRAKVPPSFLLLHVTLRRCRKSAGRLWIGW